MAFTLLHNGIEYKITDGDAARLEALYDGKPFGPKMFSFGLLGGEGGSAIIAVGTGIPITLFPLDN